MGISCGVDIVEIDRIRKATEKNRFIERIYTAGEAEYCNSRSAGKHESFAVRYAAKEAVIKALGVGKPTGITWQDIETIHKSSGKPVVLLHNHAMRCLKWKGGGANAVYVSIAHDGGKAIAFVVMERVEETK